jgi:hypothetical protein
MSLDLALLWLGNSGSSGGWETHEDLEVILE